MVPVKTSARGIIAAVIAALVLFGLGCAWFSAKPVLSETDVKRANNYRNGVFVNSEPTTVMKPGTYWNIFYQYLFTGSNERVPEQPLPVVAVKRAVEGPASESVRFVWLGHAGVLLELGGKRILVDPVFSERASFFSWLGPKRFEPPPLGAGDLPAIDAVLISHNHYDHLDKATITALASKAASFHVPLGVARTLEEWGIPKNKIREYAWWDEREESGMTVVAVPARHFSGRGLFDRDRTLWCSWVVIAGPGRVFHSGDTGMTSAFKEIGERFGPFDLAFIKIGAFNENWPDIHLTPEQAVKAGKMLRGKILCPIHWGTFDLGLHSWHEPIERFVAAAGREEQRIVVPKIGELVDPEKYENAFWWEEIMKEGREAVDQR